MATKKKTTAKKKPAAKKRTTKAKCSCKTGGKTAAATIKKLRKELSSVKAKVRKALS